MNTIRDIQNKLSGRTPETIGKHRFFSVTIPLVETQEGLSLLFEVRASKLNTQPGDICFPGGNMEAGETALECALRETEEEIGISAADMEALGQFDTLYGFSGYTLYTFPVAIRDTGLENARLNKEEVAEIFTVPLEFFVKNPPGKYDVDVVSDVEDFPYQETGISPDYRWRKGTNVIPVYKYENRVIWGMTARIVKAFTEKILAE